MYLSALRHKQISLGFPETGHTTMPKLKMISNGITRAKAAAPGPRVCQRLPITPPILRQIRSLWAPRAMDPDTIMLWAACTTAFFGFFRLGEILVPSGSLFDPTVHLTMADIAIDRRENPSMLRVHLKVSKTDQERKGTSVFIGKTGDDICPVAAMSAYLAVRGPSQGPVFQYADARPLTKVRFTDQIRDALATIGYDPKSYAGHSFRIGAASTAAERGVEDSSIKALGRWKSDAFLAYIKLPRATLAPFAKVLSSPSPGLPTSSQHAAP